MNVSEPVDPPRQSEGWTEQLTELATCIGTEATVQLIEKLGGTTVYISRRVGNPSIERAIGQKAAQRLSEAYGRERITIPTGKYLLACRRRAYFVAAARNGIISISDAARQVGTSRTYMSYLVHHTSEGR